MIANGNVVVVEFDDVIFFLTTAHGTQVDTQVYLYKQLLLVEISSGRSPGSVNSHRTLKLADCLNNLTAWLTQTGLLVCVK